MRNTKVGELMAENPILIRPDATLKEAAEQMRNVDCGVLPVGTEDRLKGMITDRDIVIRAVAKGKDTTKEKVSDYMTHDVHFCRENDTLEQAADLMHKHNVSRLVVKDKTDQLVGILSFGCILRKDADAEEISKVIEHAIRKEAA